MPEKTIYLIRHGRIELPAREKMYVGQTDLPLSREGLRQGAALAKKFSDIKLDQVWASDLSRSLTTAEFLAAAQGLTVQKKPDLREINLGEWDGLTFAEVSRQYPRGFLERGKDIVNFRPPGGESFAHCSVRVLAAFNEIIRSTDENIAIVAHAGVNRLLLCHILGMPPGNLFHIAQDYACINIILTGAFGYRVRALNARA